MLGSGPLRGDHGVDTCGIVELGERQLFVWVWRYIHHTTGDRWRDCDVSGEDVNVRAWSRQAD